MDLDKSLDDSYNLIAALLRDVQNVHGVVFNTAALRKTLRRVRARTVSEGWGFLTKTLPRIGKAFDRAISGAEPLDATSLGLKPLCVGSKLPRFLGELFSQVLNQNGTLLSEPCVTCVVSLRQVLYIFYKYELTYTEEQQMRVIQKFERTEDDLQTITEEIRHMADSLREGNCHRHLSVYNTLGVPIKVAIARSARRLLSDVFAFFDPTQIKPRHGPGAVATRQKLWDKFDWTNVCGRITDVYPLDEYFFSSLGHVCDRLETIESIGTEDLSARVVLVPKDSRGPRLISCEPVDFQWVQQGLGQAIVEHVEKCPITKYGIHFTDQGPNRRGAIQGSKRTSITSPAGYSTLDLNEASDRVSLDLVRLLFPDHLCRFLEACRSSSTELPDGRVLKLQKFAPMGSALCFPVLAITVWALLAAGAPDTDTLEGILVYGDDVIVPTAYAENAMIILESFGLKINRDKSCTSGLFRESCGMDAFNGTDVTPVRFRTIWSSTPAAGVYTSWIAYANSMFDRRYYCIYNLIVDRLTSVYKEVPEDDMSLTCPSLRSVPSHCRPTRTRTNKALQSVQYRVWDLKSPKITKCIDGWSMLLRYFTEAGRQSGNAVLGSAGTDLTDSILEPFCASQYTRRDTSLLVKRWR